MATIRVSHDNRHRLFERSSHDFWNVFLCKQSSAEIEDTHKKTRSALCHLTINPYFCINKKRKYERQHEADRIQSQCWQRQDLPTGTGIHQTADGGTKELPLYPRCDLHQQGHRRDEDPYPQQALRPGTPPAQWRRLCQGAPPQHAAALRRRHTAAGNTRPRQYPQRLSLFPRGDHRQLLPAYSQKPRTRTGTESQHQRRPQRP